MNWMHLRKGWKKEILKPNRSTTVAGTIVAVGAADGGSGDGIVAVSGITAVGAGAAVAGGYGSGTGRIIEEPSGLGPIAGQGSGLPAGLRGCPRASAFPWLRPPRGRDRRNRPLPRSGLQILQAARCFLLR